jgi:hypothetical protein
MKILFTNLLFAFINFSNAQDFSFFLHGRGLLNSSFILNNSVTTNENQSHAFALSGLGGVGATILYENKVGLSLEFLVGNHQAKYTGKEIIGVIENSYSSKVNLSKLQIPLLFRLDNEGGYIEIGPQLNIINSANYSSNFAGFTNDQVIDSYKRASISGVFGLGNYFPLGTRKSLMSLSFGFRIHYGLTDVEGVTPTGSWVINLPQKEKSILFAAGLNMSLIYQLKK